MSNWVLDLSVYDLNRVWIRGEANILADAPSRAPWEAELARNLPIPDLPLRELIKQMFVSPEAWEKMVGEEKTRMNLDEWNALEQVHDDNQDLGFKQVTAVQKTAEGEGPNFPQTSSSPVCSPLDTGAFTPEFGAQTPTFGDGIDIVRDLGGTQAACCGGTQDPRTWE